MSAPLRQTTARLIAYERALEAGLNPDTVDAVVHSAMATYHPELTRREWIEFVDDEIQRHAAP